MADDTETRRTIARLAQRLSDLAGRLADLAGELKGLLDEARDLAGESAPEPDQRADGEGRAFSWEAVVSSQTVPDSGESEAVLTFNGVDFESGDYAVPAVASRIFAAAILHGERPDPAARRQAEELAEKRWLEARKHLGPVEGVDPTDLAEAGWGVIFAEDADPEVRRRLGKLLDHRRSLAGAAAEGRYREITYRAGESKWELLARFNAGPGPVNPDEIPYYLLIAAGPASVPWNFEHTLAVEHAVGRVAFERPEDWEAYAEAVVAAETGAAGGGAAGGGAAGGGRRAAFFGVRNAADKSTSQTADHLVAPLAAWAREQGWEVRELLAEAATHANLKAELSPETSPALLFCATHGIAVRQGHPRQRELQGALLCQDWPGAAAAKGELRDEYYFAGSHVDGSVDVRGLVAFLYACHGCGTPRFDAFAGKGGAAPRELTREPFVARLPMRLLAAGALAVIGHVGQAWGWSYIWPGTAGEQLEVFESTLGRLLAGQPVGWAMEYMRRRYGELAVAMSELRQDVRGGYTPEDRELISLWTALNDARAYVVAGDPAVRLPIAPREGGS